METVVPALFPATFVVMLVVERAFPAREQPPVRGWLGKGIAFFVLAAAAGGLVPALVARAIGPHAPLGLTGGTGAAGLVGFFAGDLLGYVVHRLQHNVPWLWRWTHQMHHSAERVDVAGSAYFHPLDLAVQAGVSSLVVALLGLSPGAAALAGYLSFLAATFAHLNLRTPQWLGWIVQRPEAHSVHHARGVHAYNFGRFMLWDVVCGTFRNPVVFTGPAGFWDGASARIGAMLLGRDVGQPPGTPMTGSATTKPGGWR
jgi:sterol desaturase/sphingolipid hydroxylase (fatty acid hydroxylase superfamily)